MARKRSMTETRLLVSEAHRYAQGLDDALRVAHAGADPVTELVLRDLLESVSAARHRLSALLSALREREAGEGPGGMYALFVDRNREVTP